MAVSAYIPWFHWRNAERLLRPGQHVQGVIEHQASRHGLEAEQKALIEAGNDVLVGFRAKTVVYVLQPRWLG